MLDFRRYITSFLIGFLTPAVAIQALPYLILCGMLMIIAMILPGISGSFILVLLGAYETALSTIDLVRSFQIQGFINLAAFGLGALVGIKLFARWVEKLFASARDKLLITMSGFMFGSLYKVWPWTQQLPNSSTDRPFVMPKISLSNSDFCIGLFFIMLGISTLCISQIKQKTKQVNQRGFMTISYLSSKDWRWALPTKYQVFLGYCCHRHWLLSRVFIVFETSEF